MILAKILSNGQITLPLGIRKKLKLQPGDKVLFLKNEKGEIVIRNSSILAYREAQKAFKDVRVSEEDILSDVMELRRKKKTKI